MADNTKNKKDDEFQKHEDDVIFLNQRSTPRISVELEVTLTGAHNFFTGFTQNISEGGIFISTHQVFPIGTTFQISLTVEKRKIDIPARVMWVREDTPFLPKGIDPGMGLIFTEINDEDKELIQDFLRRKEPLFYDAD